MSNRLKWIFILTLSLSGAVAINLDSPVAFIIPACLVIAAAAVCDEPWTDTTDKELE